MNLSMDMSHVSPELERFSSVQHNEPPRHLGTRYNERGEFLNEPGNTIVCNLNEGSRTQQAVLVARKRLLAMPEVSHLAFTPTSSLHMTLFQGVIEYRRDWPYWPKDMPADTSIDEMTDHYLEKLRRIPPMPAFSMRVDRVLPTGLILKGATTDDNKVVAMWRDTFARMFGYRHPDHDTYEFHLTFAYMLQWLDPGCLPAWQRMLSECLEELRAIVPVLEMRPPAFCEFRDMKYFKERLVFDTN
jgi:hypothetical protein